MGLLRVKAKGCTVHLGDNKGFTLPDDLGSMGDDVTRIDLQESTIEGSIPDSIGDLINLEVCNLHQNNLTGALPSSIGKLQKLKELRLQQVCIRSFVFRYSQFARL